MQEETDEIEFDISGEPIEAQQAAFYTPEERQLALQLYEAYRLVIEAYSGEPDSYANEQRVNRAADFLRLAVAPYWEAINAALDEDVDTESI